MISSSSAKWYFVSPQLPRAPAAGATGEYAAALPRRDCHPALSVVGARLRAPTEARRAAGVCAASAEPPRVLVSLRTVLT